MANNLTVAISGQNTKTEVEGETVGELRRRYNVPSNYAASINGDPAEDSDYVEDYQHVAFFPAVKAA